MTVAVKPRSIDYLEDGVSVDFALPWRFNDPTDIQAQRTAADGTLTPLAYGADYSVTGGETDAGGTLTVTAPAVAGTKLSAWSVTSRGQTADYETDDNFPAETHEARLDNLAMVDQEQDAELGRRPSFPRGSTAVDFADLGQLADGDILEYRGGKIQRKDPVAFAGKFYGGDATGRMVPLAGTGSDEGLRTDLASAAAGGHLVALAQGGSAADALTNLITPQSQGGGTGGVASAIDAARGLALAVVGTTDPSQISGGVTLPPGEYTLAAAIALVDPPTAGHDGASLHLVAAPGSVRIIVPAGAYAFECAGRLVSVYVEGITFVGGKGALRHSYTGVNVAKKRSFVRCQFLDYTECAISSNASDNPYWTVEDCYFRGAVGSDTRAIALTGLLDDLRIEGNTFTNDQYHLVLGPLASAGYIMHNSFLSYIAGECDADIVLVPNETAAAFGVSAGEGLLIGWNKFGNEQLNEAAPRFLMARLTGGTGVENAAADPTWTLGAAGANYISGIQIKGNNFIFDGGYAAPLIRSYVNEISNVLFHDDNRFIGGIPTYLVEWMGAHTYDYSRAWDVRLSRYGLHKAFGLPFSLGVSNCPMGTVRMPTLFAGAEIPHSPAGSAEHTLAFCSVDTDWSTQAPHAKAAGTGPRDAVANAAAATVGNATTAALFKQFDATGYTDRAAWLVLQLQKSATEPVQRVRVQLFNFTDGTLAYDRYHVLDPKWGQIAEPVMIPTTAHPAAWQLRITAADYAAGNEDKFLAARLHIHTGPSPQPCPAATYVADVAGAAGANPTQAEYATAVAAINAMLAQMRRNGGMKLA